MDTKEWAKDIADQVRKIVDNGGSVSTMIQTPDQRGDGYDIAVAPHVDAYDELLSALDAAGITGALVEKIYASGALCAYWLQVPAADEVIRNCQHPGAWGPWYHLSLYRRNPKTGKWRFVEELGRSGRGDPRYGFGRP